MKQNAAHAPLHAALARAEAALNAHWPQPPMHDWLVRALATAAASLDRAGDAARWCAALDALPALAVTRAAGPVDANRAHFAALDDGARRTLTEALRALGPWRKGPFELGDVVIDAEWRADLKWARVAPHLAPLADRVVLDVGCGNGYYARRMAAAGARIVLGIDPQWRMLAQYAALERYLPPLPVVLLPLGSAALDVGLHAFDTVFSMGVLYHRRDPLAHLAELRRALRAGGELVLETLIVDGADAWWPPQGRYAGMRNAWVLPSPAAIANWLADHGFGAIRCVDVSVTTCAEQRRTVWMDGHSLVDFLDPEDPTRTREGYPAPRRAVFLASAL